MQATLIAAIAEIDLQCGQALSARDGKIGRPQQRQGVMHGGGPVWEASGALAKTLFSVRNALLRQ
jgi:hypothetical protein